MNEGRIRERLSAIFDINPILKDIFLSSHSLDIKRIRIRNFLTDMLIATFEDNPSIPPLEWTLTRNAVNAAKNIISTRSERLVGFSLLKYVDDLFFMDSLDNV